MNLVAIDPGKGVRTGHAVFVDDVLVMCGNGMLSKLDLCDRGLVPIDFVAWIEKPRWYGQNNKIDANDLIDLAELVGEYRSYYAGLGCRVETVWPRTWKGNVPDDIMQRRILSALSTMERALVPLRPRVKNVDHNVSDAIGIGLWKLGRLK